MSACGGGYIVDMLSVKVFVTHLLSTGSVSFIILKKPLMFALPFNVFVVHIYLERVTCDLQLIKNNLHGFGWENI